jgi:hypothetical protein
MDHPTYGRRTDRGETFDGILPVLNHLFGRGRMPPSRQTRTHAVRFTFAMVYSIDADDS